MIDDLKTIYEALNDEEKARAFFRVDSVSQFHIEFELWMLNGEDNR